MAAPTYLIDTNIVFLWAKGGAAADYLRRTYRLDDPLVRPLICEITQAEAFAFASYRQWGADRIESLQELLASTVMIDISDADVLDAYVDLYVAARSSGNDYQNNQNDLWIAAAAKAVGATLVTDDNRFAALAPHHLDCVVITADRQNHQDPA
jgi:predicted nucleic acid-binding protein